MFKEAKTQFSTVRDLLRFAVSRFNEAKLTFGHGSLNAYDEAADCKTQQIADSRELCFRFLEHLFDQ